MIFDQMTGALYADDGSFLKSVRCPLALRPDQLADSALDTPDRFCNACQKTILCIDEATDNEVRAALSDDESLCVFATPAVKNIVFLHPIGTTERNHDNLPVVRTMRSLEAMSDAVARGHKLVIGMVGEEHTFGDEKFCVYQHKTTGELWWSGDYRQGHPSSANPKSDLDEWELIRDWFFVRPDRPFPLAAYSVPRSMPIGARVFLEDLIEDISPPFWNQGNSHRLVSSVATWDGAAFDIRRSEMPMVVG